MSEDQQIDLPIGTNWVQMCERWVMTSHGAVRFDLSSAYNCDYIAGMISAYIIEYQTVSPEVQQYIKKKLCELGFREEP